MKKKKENKRKFYIIIAIIIAIFSIVVLIQFLNYSSYRKKTESYIENLEENVGSLHKEGEELKENLEELNEEFENLNKSHIILEGEVQSTIKKIETYQNEIQESMKWFNDNSILPEDKGGNRYLERTYRYLEREECIEKVGKKCYIKSACIHFVNSIRNRFNYKEDIETSLEEDKLQSLDEFLENKGGDCEDYSLFFKAENNYLKEESIESGCSDIVIEGWVESEGDKYYVDPKMEYFYDNAKRFLLKGEYIYPNIVCGNIYDLNLDKVSGHCVVAFTKEQISSEDLNELNEAPLIEPQSGEYMGLINDASSGIYLSKNYGVSYIYEVITDDDLYLFSDENNKWLSYSMFNQELNEKKMELIDLVN
ncbi:MAG: hypothetical protein ISS48_01965 [Candidatus Aenigmarchaeota archaeon]|nr:hypothetical protein [Candidatus Aenigmarchaeota archaeon]